MVLKVWTFEQLNLQLFKKSILLNKEISMRSYNTDIFLKINVLNLSCISENKNYDKLFKTKIEP